METIKITKKSATTIVEIAALALEHIPMTFSNSDSAPGRKVFFPIPMKKDPKNTMDFVYVYAESKLVGAPRDQISGFTEEDIVDQTGVYMFRKNKDSKIIQGETFPLDVFLTDVIKDLSLQNRIIYRVSEMRNIVHLDEQFLDIANHEWRANKANAQSFGIQRLH